MFLTETAPEIEDADLANPSGRRWLAPRDISSTDLWRQYATFCTRNQLHRHGTATRYAAAARVERGSEGMVMSTRSVCTVLLRLHESITWILVAKRRLIPTDTTMELRCLKRSLS